MLETDYLIVGTGAVGMAFADTLLSETDANILLVDRYPKPGGHWNVAYPFVTLHQPSQFYGVNSMELSQGRKDETGWNKGLSDLATGVEVQAYFDELMRHTFLPSGRVQYYPLCDYKGNFEFQSMLNGNRHQVKVRKKLVDCTYLNTSVPATHTPDFSIEEGVQFIPLNEIPRTTIPPAGWVIIGGGKTGIDACLYLLEHDVDPKDITWIVSRDAWLIDRRNTQPSEEFFEQTIGSQAAQMEAVALASSISDLFDRLEHAGVLVRMDETVRPQMFHGATVSSMELEQLRRIKKVIRMGRVRSIDKDMIILEQGSIPTTTKHIHVDCSASAITNLSIKPIFQGDLITPQTVRSYQPVFSAAFIAHVEAAYEDNGKKNKLCQVVPLPNHDTDWIPMMAAQMVNQFIWSQDKGLRKWLYQSRLDGFSRLIKDVDKNDEKKTAILHRMRKNALPASIKLQQFAAELELKKRLAITNPQFQVRKDAFFSGRLADVPVPSLKTVPGEVLVMVEKFAYTSNNITYAAAGDMLGYWHFFPPAGKDSDVWGIIPVWGFAEVVESQSPEIPRGERFFGYFPPAKYLKMKPVGISTEQFIDGSAHRAHLPGGYNLYRRIQHEPRYDPALDEWRMLLWPLYLTAFCLWDDLKENNWYDAKQVIVMSASSKTSIGLGYALQSDDEAPQVIGVTSERNFDMVRNLKLYNQCETYNTFTDIDDSIPSVIVDMSGNAKVMASLHKHLGKSMKCTLNVGITHWPNTRTQEGIIRERSKMFFAPAHIQQRIKDWGPKGFNEKTSSFISQAAVKTSKWLTIRKVDGLAELATIHPAVCAGQIAPDEGLIVFM